jgi:hypothetical protein
MSDVVYRGPEGVPAESGVPISKPDVPISESQREQREPRVPFSERVRRKLERDHGGGPVASKDEDAVRSLSPDREEPKIRRITAAKLAHKDGTVKLGEVQAAHSALHMRDMGHHAGSLVGIRPDQMSDEQAQETGEWVAQHGRKPSEEAPKVKMGLVTEGPDGAWKSLSHFKEGKGSGGIRQQMKARGETEETVGSSAEALARFRAVRESALEADLEAGRAQTEAARPTPEVGREIDALAAASDAEVQRQQPARQTQIDPAMETERQQLQLERAWSQQRAEYARLSAEERRAVDAIARIDAAAAKDRVLQDRNLLAQSVERARRGDVREQKRQQSYQKAFQARQSWEKHFETHNVQRVSQEIKLTQMQQAAQAQEHEARKEQHRAWKAQQDTAFDQWVQNEHPQYATADGKRQLTAIVREHLAEKGLNRQQVDALWAQGYWNSAQEQQLLTEAALFRHAKKAAANISRDLPTVAEHEAGRGYRIQTRGEDQGFGRSITVGPRGGGDDDIKKWQGRVSGAKSERQALIAATALMKARRGR